MRIPQYNPGVGENVHLHAEEEEQNRIDRRKILPGIVAATAYGMAQAVPQKLAPFTWSAVLLGNALAFPPERLPEIGCRMLTAATFQFSVLTLLSGYTLPSVNPWAEPIATSVSYLIGINYIWYAAHRELRKDIQGNKRAFVGSVLGIAGYKLAQAYLANQAWANFLATSAVIAGNMLAFPPKSLSEGIKCLFVSNAPNFLATYQGPWKGYPIDFSSDPAALNVLNGIRNSIATAVGFYLGIGYLQQGLKERRRLSREESLLDARSEEDVLRASQIGVSITEAPEASPSKQAISALWEQLEQKTAALHLGTINLGKRTQSIREDCIMKTAVEIDGEKYVLHANYISMDGKPQFIAAQRPLRSSWGLFWRLAWDQQTIFAIDPQNTYCPLIRDTIYPGKCSVTVPETGFSEKFILPESDREKNSFKLQCFNYQVQYNYRQKEVHRIYMPWWMDQQIIPIGILDKLVDELGERKKEKPDQLPIIHCTTGLGQTCTLIAAYFLKQKIQDGSINALNFDTQLLELVLNIREQRGRLAVEQNQFELLWDYGQALLKGTFQDRKDPQPSSGRSLSPLGRYEERKNYALTVQT